MIIRDPGIKANQFPNANVIGYDLFPTICELAGICSSPANIEGISLVPLSSGKNKFKDRQRIFHFPHYGIGPRQKPMSALIQGKYKLVKLL